MQKLIETLYDNNVLFSYYGFIDSSVLEQVLQITKSKLEYNKESPFVIAKIYDTINECVENIIEHNFFPEDAILHYKSLLLVAQKDNSYSIDTINVINANQKKNIDEQLIFLNAKSKDELRVLKEQITENNTANAKPEGTGLGLINLLLKSDNCEYQFVPYEHNFLFSINFFIQSNQHFLQAK